MGLLDSLKSEYLMCENGTWDASHLKLLQLGQFNLANWSIGGILMCLPMMLFFLLIGCVG